MFILAQHFYLHTGHPTNEQRLILGLGLGGSEQDIDTSSHGLVFSLLCFGCGSTDPGVNMSATRCPHRNTAGEVCQHLSGKSKILYTACVSSRSYFKP